MDRDITGDGKGECEYGSCEDDDIDKDDDVTSRDGEGFGEADPRHELYFFTAQWR